MALFDRSPEVLARYQRVLQSQLYSFLNKYDFDKLYAADKLKIASDMKTALDKSAILSSRVPESMVPIKATYQQIYDLLFKPQSGYGRSYLDMLEDAAVTARTSSADIMFYERHLTAELQKLEQTINKIASSQKSAPEIQNAQRFMNATRSSSLLKAAVFALALLSATFVATSSAHGQIKSDSVTTQIQDQASDMNLAASVVKSLIQFKLIQRSQKQNYHGFQTSFYASVPGANFQLWANEDGSQYAITGKWTDGKSYQISYAKGKFVCVWTKTMKTNPDGTENIIGGTLTGKGLDMILNYVDQCLGGGGVLR